MTPFLKSLAMRVPAVRAYKGRVDALRDERDRLAQQVQALSSAVDRGNANTPASAGGGWAEEKARRNHLSEEFRVAAGTARLAPHLDPVRGHLEQSVREFVRHQMENEPYWFQKIEVLPGLFSPGWSDPVVEKLPYFGLPQDLTNKRVLDIGCAEGFFSFEAEKRGAREVIGIDSFPDSVRRFNITKAARQSNASAFLMNVYDLEPRRLGTFDLVLFYGVFYHLKHPQLALERIRSVCTGDILFQTAICEEPAVTGTPWARFYPYGLMSGSNQELYDPTVFWLFNSACCLAMLDHVGFTNLKVLSHAPFVVSGKSPSLAPGAPPDQAEAPWS
jgi:tRNA (mo5U34)-methyltransferase